VTGVGSSLIGGYNMSNYKIAFGNPSVFFTMVLTWIVLVLALAGCVAAFVRRPWNSGPRLLAAFTLALFLLGEVEGFYGQPQDPQIQIEPMFVIVPAAILLAGWSFARARLFWRCSVVAALALAAAANGEFNLDIMNQSRGLDSQAIAGVNEQNRLFPKDRTVTLCQGFEGWLAWQATLSWNGDLDRWLTRNYQLSRPFTMKRGIGGADAAALMSRQIDDAFASGLRVVSSALWNAPVEASVLSYTTVTDEADARVYVTTLLDRYRTGERWNTRFGPFVELLQKQPNSQ
jgi:hypothetical protein